MPEIWIYTTDYKERTEPPIKVSTVKCLVDDIPKDRHWILVYISEEENVTMYVDARNKNGKLEPRIFYKEPQDVITKTRIGLVSATAEDIHVFYSECRERKITYGLNWSKSSCQSFVKELLQKLGVSSDLKIINDSKLGSYVEAAKKSSDTFNRFFDSICPPKEKKN
ncbi:UNVERIFIED_CONTAM: hypothetical protein RMT77_013039 [Armadillidium vulgare]